MKVLVLGGVFAVLFFSEACASPRAPEPAKPVELDRYLGRWHEFARYPNPFERGCAVVTADYGRLGNGALSVLNTCREVGGRVRTARGKARVVGGNGAKLKVSFFGPFYSDYWILDRAEDYSWALVGDSKRRLFWILTRDPEPSNRSQLISRAGALGYDEARLVRRPSGGPRSRARHPQ